MICTNATSRKVDMSKQDSADCVHFVNCPSSRRIKLFLSKYHHFACGTTVNIGHALDTIFNDQYSVVNLLDDYHHILLQHSINHNALQFQKCYDFMVSGHSTKCQSDKCHAFRLHNARRHGIDYKKDHQQQQMNWHSCDVVQDDYRIGILNQIHCFLLHATETTKLSKKDITEYEKLSFDENGKRKWIMDRMRMRRQNMRTLLKSLDKCKSDESQRQLRQVSHPEMKTVDSPTERDECVQMEDEETLNEFCRITKCNERVGAVLLKDFKWDLNAALQTYYILADDATSFELYAPPETADAVLNVIHTEGVHCWYWNVSDGTPSDVVVVHRRHRTLKEEMLNLKQHRISRRLWSNIYSECRDLMQSEQVKILKSYGNGADIYGIKSGDGITLHHLIAIKIYTNFTKLNSMFCEHFRLKRLSGNVFETRESLGIRNGKFWNLAKLLIECVQCFGKLIVTQDDVLYRGLSEAVMFHSFITRLYTPLSTSRSELAAMAFCGDSGVVIEITGYDREFSGLDVHWLSNYPEESEVILFGGRSILRISRLHKLEFGEMNLLEDELVALQVIRSFCRGAPIGRLSDEVKQIIFTVIESILDGDLENHIKSTYFCKLIKHQIENAPSRIIYDFDILWTDFKFLHQIIIKNGTTRIFDIFKMHKIFSSSTDVICLMPNSCEQRQEFWDAVVSSISRIDNNVSVTFQWMDDIESCGQAMALLSWQALSRNADRISTLHQGGKVSLKDSQIIISRTVAVLSGFTSEFRISALPTAGKPAADVVLVVDPGVHVTYMVTKTFDYYVCMASGAKVTFKSKNGNPICITKNIWGPGSVEFSGNITVSAPLGSAPNQQILKELKAYHYKKKEIEVFIP